MDISYVLNEYTYEYKQDARLVAQPLRGHAKNRLQTVGRLNTISTTRTIPKVPIPKVNSRVYPQQCRVERACEPCRKQKSKCDGQQPRCRRCSLAQAKMLVSNQETRT